jgi:hypothetical protein
VQKEAEYSGYDGASGRLSWMAFHALFVTELSSFLYLILLRDLFGPGCRYQEDQAEWRKEFFHGAE